MLGFTVIILGFLLTCWSVYHIKSEKLKNTNMKKFNLMDILINGFESSIGQFVCGVVFIITGVIIVLLKK